MSRVREAWSPNNADLILTRQSDATLVQRAFECAIAGGSEASQELYERRLAPQFNAEKTSDLWFDDGEAPVVIDALATFARTLPETGRNFLIQRKTQSLIGCLAIAARHEYKAV